METPEGSFDITDGKVAGDRFTFKSHAGDSNINDVGTLSGATIQLKVNGLWGESNITLARAAAKPADKQL